MLYKAFSLMREAPSENCGMQEHRPHIDINPSKEPELIKRVSFVQFMLHEGLE